MPINPKVYIVQEVPGINVLSARRFGDLQTMLPSGQISMRTNTAVLQLKKQLKFFKAEDYLLLIGDPLLIGLATAIALESSGGHARFLKWDRQTTSYYALEASI